MTQREEDSLEKLESRYKKLNTLISEIDNVLYGDGYDEFVQGKSKKYQFTSLQRLSDLRYEYADERSAVCDKISRLKREKYKNMNQNVLNFGCYNDVHTPKIVGSNRNRFCAIKGISL